MKKLYVLLDNGHGSNTSGKRSPKLPDGTQFFEYEFTRDVVDSLAYRLNEYPQFVPIKVTPEKTDISLTTRVNRINDYCKKYGAGNCIMISVHVNAAGNGSWMTGRGWSAWTTPGQNNSDKLAECLYDAAEELLNSCHIYIKNFPTKNTKQKPIRVDKSDGDRDYEANYQIIKGSNCPAVLTENYFMDNKEDVEYLMSQGLNDTVALHMKGIENYYVKYKK